MTPEGLKVYCPTAPPSGERELALKRPREEVEEAGELSSRDTKGKKAETEKSKKGEKPKKTIPIIKLALMILAGFVPLMLARFVPEWNAYLQEVKQKAEKDTQNKKGTKRQKSGKKPTTGTDGGVADQLTAEQFFYRNFWKVLVRSVLWIDIWDHFRKSDNPTCVICALENSENVVAYGFGLGAVITKTDEKPIMSDFRATTLGKHVAGRHLLKTTPTEAERNEYAAKSNAIISNLHDSYNLLVQNADPTTKNTLKNWKNEISRFHKTTTDQIQLVKAIISSGRGKLVGVEFPVAAGGEQAFELNLDSSILFVVAMELALRVFEYGKSQREEFDCFKESTCAADLRIDSDKLREIFDDVYKKDNASFDHLFQPLVNNSKVSDEEKGSFQLADFNHEEEQLDDKVEGAPPLKFVAAPKGYVSKASPPSPPPSPQLINPTASESEKTRRRNPPRNKRK
jgi:hypothetical protein